MINFYLFTCDLHFPQYTCDDLIFGPPIQRSMWPIDPRFKKTFIIVFTAYFASLCEDWTQNKKVKGKTVRFRKTKDHITKSHAKIHSHVTDGVSLLAVCNAQKRRALGSRMVVVVICTAVVTNIWYVAVVCLRFRNTWHRITSVCFNKFAIKFQAYN